MLFTRRLPILRQAQERKLEKDLILDEVESIKLSSKTESFSSASRLAFSRRSLANASASSASATTQALRAFASTLRACASASRASASTCRRALWALAIFSVLSTSAR